MSNITETISKTEKMRFSNIRLFFKYSKAHSLAYKHQNLKQLITVLNKFELGDYTYNGGMISIIGTNYLFEDSCNKVAIISHIHSKYRLCIGYPKFRVFSIIQHTRIERIKEKHKIAYNPIDVPTQDLNNLCHFMALILCKGFIYVVEKI